MNAEEALAWLHGTLRFGSKPGLRRIQALLERMGHPERKLRFAHIAGTNGKGSTAAMLESVLRAAGYKTGLFISPYLEDFRERIQVNRRLMPHEDLARLITELRGTVETMLQEGGEQPSEFELVTALGFRYFVEQNCDIVVLEVGLGGRFDSTNVIESCEVAALTSISMDHMEYLGDTLDKIAYEKCGILKKGCEAVSYPEQATAAAEIIRQRCREEGVTLRIPSRQELSIYHSDLSGSSFRYRGAGYRITLVGAHQIMNALTVLEIADALRTRGFDISCEAAREGLHTACWAGRLETVCTEPLCILDGAHNEDGVRVLAAAIDALLGDRRLIAVMAMLAKKDYRVCVPLITSRCDVLIATEVKAMPGTLPAAELAALAEDAFSQEGRNGRVLCYPEPGEAVRTALSEAAAGDVILALGSLYMVGEVRHIFRER